MKSAIRPEAAAELIPNGATLLVGGFMGVGSPHWLIVGADVPEMVLAPEPAR